MYLTIFLSAALLLQVPSFQPGSSIGSFQLTAQSPDAKTSERYRVPDLLKALRAEPGNTIADLGCGEGLFTVPLARAVGDKGRVFAVDIDKQALEGARKRLERENVRNAELVLGKEDDPLLPADQLDSVFIMNAYH